MIEEHADAVRIELMVPPDHVARTIGGAIIGSTEPALAFSTPEYFRDRGAFFRSIHGTLNHVLLVDQHYLGALQGVDVDPLPLGIIDGLTTAHSSPCPVR